MSTLTIFIRSFQKQRWRQQWLFFIDWIKYYQVPVLKIFYDVHNCIPLNSSVFWSIQFLRQVAILFTDVNYLPLWNIPESLLLAELLGLSQCLRKPLVQRLGKEEHNKCSNDKEHQQDDVRVSGIVVCSLKGELLQLPLHNFNIQTHQ